MPKEQRVVAFIADLKYTPDGGVKILELGGDYESGFAGFDGLPSEQKIASAESFLGRSALQGLASRNNLGMEAIIVAAKERVASLHNPEPFLFEDNAQIDTRFFSNKSFHPLFFSQADRQKILPPQAMFPTVLTPSQAADIGENLAVSMGMQGNSGRDDLAASGCVVKRTEQSHGVGVTPLPLAALGPFILEHFCPQDRKKPHPEKAGSGDGLDGRTGWENCNDPVFIVQQRIKGMPVEFKVDFYDPTMRMVFAAWKEDGGVRLARLGEYWKLPSQPIMASEGMPREAIISDISHGGFTRYQQPRFPCRCRAASQCVG